MVTKEEFNKVWKDSTKKDILNQFYYEHIAIRKAIEYIENNSLYTEDYDYDEEENLRWLGAHDYKESEDLLNILQNGSDSK